MEFQEVPEIRALSGMDAKRFSKAFQFLLENGYITAFKNGRIRNPNWSTFIYSTAETWEKYVSKVSAKNDAKTELKTILSRTMPEKELDKLIK